MFQLVDDPIVPLPLAAQMHERERVILVDSLIACEGNHTEAAKVLGLSRATLYRKLARHHLVPIRPCTWRAFAEIAHALTLYARMQGYHDAAGISCCGKTDCRPADITAINQARGEVLIDGVPLRLPPGSGHRIPPEAHEPDASGYWCFRANLHEITAANTRCVFYKTPYW